jgi:hypothetical protein
MAALVLGGDAGLQLHAEGEGPVLVVAHHVLPFLAFVMDQVVGGGRR